jgi:hypothetical protein
MDDQAYPITWTECRYLRGATGRLHDKNGGRRVQYASSHGWDLELTSDLDHTALGVAYGSRKVIPPHQTQFVAYSGC